MVVTYIISVADSVVTDLDYNSTVGTGITSMFSTSLGELDWGEVDLLISQHLAAVDGVPRILTRSLTKLSSAKVERGIASAIRLLTRQQRQTEFSVYEQYSSGLNARSLHISRKLLELLYPRKNESGVFSQALQARARGAIEIRTEKLHDFINEPATGNDPDVVPTDTNIEESDDDSEIEDEVNSGEK